MENKIEKVAMVLAVVFLVALIVSTFYRVGPRPISLISCGTISAIVVIVQIGCGGWLYQKTKPKQQYPCLWCLLGFVFGLMAIVTYYIIEIYKKVSIQEE